MLTPLFNVPDRRELKTIVSMAVVAAFAFGQAKRIDNQEKSKASAEFRQASLTGDGRHFLSSNQRFLYQTTAEPVPTVTRSYDFLTNQTCVYNQNTHSLAYWLGNPQLHSVQGTKLRIRSYPQQQKTCT